MGVVWAELVNDQHRRYRGYSAEIHIIYLLPLASSNCVAHLKKRTHFRVGDTAHCFEGRVALKSKFTCEARSGELSHIGAVIGVVVSAKLKESVPVFALLL